VDYSLSTEEVFVNAILVCIATARNLNVLQAARSDDRQSLKDLCSFSIRHLNDHLGTLPYPLHTAIERPQTWNPRIRLESPEGIPLFATEDNEAGPSSPVQIAVQVLPPGQILPCLRVHAYRLDAVRGSHELDCPRFLNWCKSTEYREEYHNKDAKGRYTTTLQKGVSPLGCHFLPPYSSQDLLSLLEVLARVKDPGDILFGTQHGLGVCHEYTSPRDYVFLLDGVNQPLVLRPLENAGCSSEQGTDSGYRRFRIVSVCWWQRLPLLNRLEETCAAEGRSRHEIIEVY
jgi:hypothetical protein